MKRALAIAMMMVGTARADRPAADQLFKEAEAAHDPAKLEACGNAYLDVANADPAAPSNDEVLYNAAICFTAAHSAGAADVALRQIVVRYPNSKWTARALQRLGEIAEVTGRFDEAARRFEEYAHKYAGEKDALDAIENAFAYRAMLGDDALAIEDAKYTARTYGLRRRGEIAAMMLRLVPIYEKQGQPIPFVESLVKDYAKGLDDGQLVVVLAKLGELKWDATCKGRSLCATEAPAVKTPRCHTGVLLRADKRSATTDAEASLAAAVKAFEERQPADPAARHAYAMTKLRLADRALESYLAIGFPHGLDFSEKARAKDTARFNQYIQDKTKLGGVAERAYQDVFSLKDADAAIAATARIGQLSASFAASLRTAEIPGDLRRGEFAKDKTEAYCSKMSEVSEPLATRALQAFAICRVKSVEVGVDTAWTALCRREASALDPKLVVDEPQLGAVVPIHPQPWMERAGAQAAALANTGTTRWTAGDRPGAIEAWQRAVAADGKVAAAHYGLALASFADPARDQDTERSLLNASVADPARAEPKIMLALFELRRGRPLVAQLYLSRVTGENPALLVARAAVRARDGRFEDARAPLEQADKNHWPQAGYDLALLALRRHDFADALARLQGVKPGYDALVALGAAHAGLGHHAEARAAYDSAIALDAARPDAHFDLGLDLAAQAKFHDAAAEFDLAKATALADRYRAL